MAYIWNEYDDKKRFIVSENSVSPYLEVWNTKSDVVPVNIYIRLMDYLVPLGCSEEYEKDLILKYINNKKYADIANVLMHYVAMSDLKTGYTVMDILAKILEKDILEGKYGDDIICQYNLLTFSMKEKIKFFLAKYIFQKERECQIDAALRNQFERMNLYYEKSSGKIYVYIDEHCTSENKSYVDLCIFFFKDIFTDLEVLWAGKHFGVINVQETMLIDKIAMI